MMREENGWKVEDYHGATIKVRAQQRKQENPALDGHGHEWDFQVAIDDDGTRAGGSLIAASPASVCNGALATGTAADANIIRSDQNVFYSTEVIAEQMGFIKARELVDHRKSTTPSPNAGAQATDGNYSANATDKGEHGKSTL